MKNPLRQQAFNKAKNNIYANIAIGIFCGLAMILVTMLTLIDFAFLIIVIPFFLLPFLFACHISSYYLQINQPVSMPGFFSYFLGYFRPQFRGTFRAISSFAKAVLFYLGGTFVFSAILYFIFQSYYGQFFVDAVEEFVVVFNLNELSIEDFNNMLNANNGLLLTFFAYAEAMAIAPLMLSFIYFISFSSISLYYRANVLVSTIPIIRLCVNNTYRRFGKEMRKDWWALNWPLLALSVFGMVVASVICIFAIQDITLLPSLVMIGSVALLFIFLPFYYPNIEVIYKKYENHFKQGNEQAINEIIQKLQRSIDFSAEEKKNIEESLKNEQNDDDNQ